MKWENGIWQVNWSEQFLIIFSMHSTEKILLKIGKPKKYGLIQVILNHWTYVNLKISQVTTTAVVVEDFRVGAIYVCHIKITRLKAKVHDNWTQLLQFLERGFMCSASSEFHAVTLFLNELFNCWPYVFAGKWRCDMKWTSTKWAFCTYM